jgi:hypothetical protein
VANVSLMTKDAEVAEKVNNLYTVGFDALVKRCNKCINVGGGYVEK